MTSGTSAKSLRAAAWAHAMAAHFRASNDSACSPSSAASSASGRPSASAHSRWAKLHWRHELAPATASMISSRKAGSRRPSIRSPAGQARAGPARRSSWRCLDDRLVQAVGGHRGRLGRADGNSIRSSCVLAQFRRRRSAFSHPGILPGRRSLLLIVALGFHVRLFSAGPAAGRAVDHVRRSMPGASSRRNRTAWSRHRTSRQDGVAPYALASTGSTFPAPWSSW